MGPYERPSQEYPWVKTRASKMGRKWLCKPIKRAKEGILASLTTTSFKWSSNVLKDTSHEVGEWVPLSLMGFSLHGHLLVVSYNKLVTWFRDKIAWRTSISANHIADTTLMTCTCENLHKHQLRILPWRRCKESTSYQYTRETPIFLPREKKTILIWLHVWWCWSYQIIFGRL